MRTSSCLSKQSSTESITEEFYRFMLQDMDKENKDYSLAKTKSGVIAYYPHLPEPPFCIRQSSVPDRRSSDSRLTVNSPIKPIHSMVLLEMYTGTRSTSIQPTLCRQRDSASLIHACISVAKRTKSQTC